MAIIRGLDEAVEAFRPERFGFLPRGRGWVREFPGYGPVVVTAVGWPHAQSPSYDVVDGRRVGCDVLGLIANLQMLVWGMPPELVVPTNVLAITPDGGGAVLAAYREEIGFNADGWIGFIIGFGARSGTLVSHMLGVREEARGAADFGWHLKLIQAYEALRSGHQAMIWTFDPMRGGNARLNLEKLGATVQEFTLDKYGVLPSTLYGNVPSDRFTAHWELRSTRVQERVAGVRDGTYRSPTLQEIVAIDEATPENVASLAARRPERIRYRIPGDIDVLMQRDPEAAIAWRRGMREVFAALLTSKRVRFASGRDPLSTTYDTTTGNYAITGFVTSVDATGEPSSYYLFERTRP